MTSNSPGMYSRSLQDHFSEEHDMFRDLLSDVSGSSGKLLLPLASGFQRDVPFVLKDSGYYVNTSDGASTCSSGTAETCDLEGGALLLLEQKSLRNFTTNDEYLFAMKEDLADWFSSLYQNVDITADSLFKILETGVLLCKHANKVQEFARQHRELGEILEMRSYFIRSVPEFSVPYRQEVKPETFQARDNVSNFISWTRQLGIPEVLSFETDDLVLRKNEKSVILSLLEVARIGAKLGMLAPTLVQMEQEIDAELAGEKPRPLVQIKTCDLRSLDERVRDLIGRCKCPVQFPMIKVGEGKYKIGDTRNLIFVRILRNHVMVRVGGGWDTLENYLNKHDPCQCNYKGHRPGSIGVAYNAATSQQRRSSIPNNKTLTPSDSISSSPKHVSPVATTSKNRPASPQTSLRTSSPILVISCNSPAPPSSGGKASNSAKGGRIRPSQNRQEGSKEASSRQSSKSSSTSSANQLIRSNSPSVGHLKRHANSTISQNIIIHHSSSRTSSNPGVSKSRHPTRGNKNITPRKDSPRSSNSLNEGDDLVADNDAYLAEDDESDNPNLREDELRPTTIDGQTDLYILTQLPSSCLEQALQSDSINLVKQQWEYCEQHDGMLSRLSQTINPDLGQTLNSQESIPSKFTTKQANMKDIHDSSESAGATIRMKSLSQFSDETRGSHSTALKTHKQSAHTDLQSNIDISQDIAISCSEMPASLSRPSTATSSLGFGQNLAGGLEIGTVIENTGVGSKLPSHRINDTAVEVANSISDWLESTKEIVFRELSNDQSTTYQTLTEPCSHMLQQVNYKSDKNKTIEISDTSVNQYVESLASASKERPAKITLIPKPFPASHLTTPKSHSSVSSYSAKSDTSMFNPTSEIDSNLYQDCINIIPMNSPLVLTKSSSNSSSIKSLDEITTINNSRPVLSQTQAGRISVSESSHINRSNNANPRNLDVGRKDVTPSTSGRKDVTHSTSGRKDVTPSTSGRKDVTPPTSGRKHVTSSTSGRKHVTPSTSGRKDVTPSTSGRKDVTPSTSGRNPNVMTHMTGTHDKQPVSKGFSALGNTNSMANYTRNPENTVPQRNATPLTPASLLHHTLILESERQVSNDITFSDDEEVNEIFKNSALKERANDVRSSSTTARQVLHHNKNEEILLINRNSSGHHSVQQIQKNELKHELTPKSRLMHRPHSSASTRIHSAAGQAVSRSSSKTPDLAMLQQRIAPVRKKKALNEKESAVSSRNINTKSTTQACVGSTLLDNKRKPLCKLQAKDIGQ